MGCSPFARHYSGNNLFSSGYLDVSVPQVPFGWPMCSASRCRWFAAAGFPIRTSPDNRLYTAPRGFSQCPTSFFGVWRQGIHRKPFLTYSRDAEKSKFFVLVALYSLGKVQSPSSALSAEKCLSLCFVRGTSRPTTSRFLRNTTRLIAGSRKRPYDVPEIFY